MVVQSVTHVVRYCGNFPPSVCKEMPKTRYFTLEEALQRFLDDEQSENDFIVPPENLKASDEEGHDNILNNDSNVLQCNTAGPLFKNTVEKSFCLPISFY
ncbi:hypothetical protein AVEN_131020-1 [Araneus ventricosus]|uniref:Uncharacterized protein n=1 Tax=Araneus ventricosus TaxID=182803 RepID=A0A4Y2QWU6_ARAVE|nr:hypothetical protein AVEN_131020-1 [Araneus ventricosus]